MEPVRAVFFDFGGTLFSYQSLGRSGFIPLLTDARARLGVPANLKEAGRAYNQASGESFAEFADRPYYLHSDLFRDTYRRFALALGGEPDEDFVAWLHERQRSMFFDACVLRPGCIEMLAALRDRGIHTAIVSNIDDDYLLPMVEKLGLDRVLDGWTSSEEAESCKPDPAIFDYCMQKAGVGADQTFFVGDSPLHDIAGARRAGMRTVLIRESSGQPAPGAGDGGAEADHVIEALDELLPIVLSGSASGSALGSASATDSDSD